MSVVSPPKSVSDAILPLPDTQKPFGDNCLLARDLQAILFHYGVRMQDAEILAEEGISTLAYVKFADPDGSQDQVDLFKAAVADRVQGALHRLVLKEAFRRIVRPDPFAAIVVVASSAPPPAKRVKVVGAPSSSAASSSAAAASSSSSSLPSSADSPKASASSSASLSVDPPQKTSKFDFVSDSDSDDLAKVDDGDVSASDDVASSDKKSRSRNQDLASLFDEVDNEVGVVWFVASVRGGWSCWVFRFPFPPPFSVNQERSASPAGDLQDFDGPRR